MRNVDTASTTEIRASPIWAEVGLLLFGLPFLFFAWQFAQMVGRVIGFGRPFSDAGFATFLMGGLAFMFGALAFACLIEVRHGRRPVIFMSPEGYRDIRRSPRTIPWSEVKLITYWSGRGAHVRLDLSKSLTDEIFGKPSFWRALKAFGYLDVTPGFTSPAANLETTARDVAQTAKQYLAAHGGPRSN